MAFRGSGIAEGWCLMARWDEDAGGRWPDRLATFNADDWPPAQGEVAQTCTCASCTAKYGPPGPAPRTVAAARRRWRQARLATLKRGSYEYRAEFLVALQESLPERHRP